MYNPQMQSVYNAPSEEALAEIQRGFIARVYVWMTLGLFVTAITALFVILTPALLLLIASTPFLFMGLLAAELILVVVISRAVSRMSSWIAGLLFAGYAMLNGVTFSLILVQYTGSSVIIVFGITACTFGIMSLFGFTTQRDLTKLGSLLIMALIGLVLASVANLFFASPAIYWITTYVGVLIFVGLIAYDTQKLKRMSSSIGDNGELVRKTSILGALSLYLDFINLFMMLLRIVGRRR